MPGGGVGAGLRRGIFIFAVKSRAAVFGTVLRISVGSRARVLSVIHRVTQTDELHENKHL